MQSLKKQITINYTWRALDYENIISEHIEALEETAFDRVVEMMKDGYTSGELHDNIHMLDTDTENGVNYRGWWSITKQ